MSAIALTLLHLVAESLWALASRLLARTFVDRLMTKLVLAGLERLAASTTNTLDDSIVADVRAALTAEKGNG